MNPTLALRSFLLASAILAAATTAHAQKTWKGTTTNLWTTADSWDPSGAPAANAAVIFDGTGANLNTDFNGTARTLNSLTFTAGQTAAVTINTVVGTPLTFNPGTVLSVAAGDHRFVGTGGPSSGTSRDMLFTGTSATDTYTLDIAGGASFEIQGRIGTGGTSSSSRSYFKTGDGTLIFSVHSGNTGAWNFSGGSGLRINGGVLRMAATGASGHSGNKYTVASGAALELVGASFGSGNGAQTISGTGIGGTGAIRSVSGTNSFGTTASTGSLTLGANSSIGVDAGQLTVGLAIGDGANGYSLTKAGAGTLRLANINTYTGATVLDAGTLALAASDVLPDSSNLSIAAATLNAATFTDTVGTLDITSGATINLASGAALAFADSSALSWTGTLTLTGSFISGTSLRFGTTAGGLTAAQLDKISATGFSDFALNETGFLTATAPPGFASWQTSNSTTGDIDDDHDNDGVPNGIEYFLGGPNANTTGFTALPGVTNASGTLSVTWVKGSGYTGTYGTDFWVETSASLADPWTPETPGENVLDTATEVTYTFPAGSINFARLVVTGP